MTGQDLAMPLSAVLLVAGDLNGDDLVSEADFDMLANCMAGPDSVGIDCDEHMRSRADADDDSDIDLHDFAALQ